MTGRPSPFRFLRNLRARITVVALVALVPGFVVAFLAAQDERDSARRRAEAETATAVEVTSDRYQLILDNSDTLLHTLAAVPAVAQGSPECAPALQVAMRQAKQLYDNIVVSDADGRVRCSAASVSAGTSFTERSWFTETIRTRNFAVGGFERDGDASSYVATAIAIPVSGDRPSAVVVAQISLRALADRLAPTNLPPGAALTLTDNNDRILFRYPDSLRWTGRRANEAQVGRGLAKTFTPSPAVVAKGADGVQRVYTAAVLTPPAHAIVYAGISTKVAYAEATRQFRIRFAALIAGAVLALVLASTIARTRHRPPGAQAGGPRPAGGVRRPGGSVAHGAHRRGR